MNRFRLLFCPAALFALFAPGLACAALSVTDDSGAQVSLPQPAQRIVSLAPHATEILFAAGLGERIVGAVSYSDYPEAAKTIPRVGGYDNPDLERVLALQPDLVVGWHSGNPPRHLENLERLGIAVYRSEPLDFEQIASTIERMGQLGGTQALASPAAAKFRNELEQLRARYTDAVPISVFYQLWHQPLMTANDTHLIGKVIRLCGGRNVFGKLSQLTPTISVEAVLAVAPEVIIASGMDADRPEWLDAWRRWSQLPAVKYDALYFVPPDLIQRHSPRILQGAQQLCAHLEYARQQYNQP